MSTPRSRINPSLQRGYRRTGRRRLLFEPLEGRRLLAANLEITDAFLVDQSGNAINEVVHGERVYVRANWRATDLTSNDQYRLRFWIDGVPHEPSDELIGTDQQTSTHWWYLSGWYAAPRVHSVRVVVDPDDQVTEFLESDNEYTFTFSPVQPSTLPSKFIWPVEGSRFQDHTISNYVDVDPGSDDVDYRGNSIAYDGHRALDISTGNFATMDAGIEIYAAASGVIRTTHDGEFDRQFEWHDPAPKANYVIIDHSNGWSTKYWHLRRDSVAVKAGDAVAAGDVLGFMGSSGRSTITHLHFEVEHEGRAVETLFNPSAYWIESPGYTLDQTSALSSGITNHYPSSHRIERPSDVNVYSQASGQSFRSWVIISGINLGDVLHYASYRPDNSVYATGTVTAARNYGRSRWSFNRTLPTVPDLGSWRAS